MQPNLSINIGKLKLKNPVMSASGTFGYAEEFKDLLDTRKLGAIVSKTITIKPRQGNPPPRTCETPSGMLNSIGLENPGLEVFVKKKLPVLSKIGVPVIVSIASELDPQEFVFLAKRLDKISGVAAVELNISCPNIRAPEHRSTGAPAKSTQGLISQDADATYEVVKKVRKVTRKTLITKLSPNVTDIAEIASAAENAGSDALALINTVQAMSVDIEKCGPKIATGVGGLSGPAIRPIAVRMVWEAYRKVKIPIIGMGGIIDVESALEFLIAGSKAISVGTANFVNPKVLTEIIIGIKQYLMKNKIGSVDRIVGVLECKI